MNIVSFLLHQINDVSKWYKPWFFKYVGNILNKTPKGQTVVEYVPLRGYYHRHSRALFWELQVSCMHFVNMKLVKSRSKYSIFPIRTSFRLETILYFDICLVG